MPEETKNNETPVSEEVKRQNLIGLLTDRDLSIADEVFYLGYLERTEKAVGIKSGGEKLKIVHVEDLRNQGRMASLTEIESLIDDSEGASDEYLEYVVEKMAKARMEKLKQNKPPRKVLKLIPKRQIRRREASFGL